MKFYVFVVALLAVFSGYTQDITSNYRSKKVAVTDSIAIDSTSINPSRFEILDKDGNRIDSLSYAVDYQKGKIYFNERSKRVYDSVTVNYLRYPKYLTREYFQLNSNVVVQGSGSINKLYALEQSNKKSSFTPFDGLNAVGSLSRGVTIGNNQNAVVNSQLDLQITGKLSEKVSIRASIQDANIPTQEGGYSQSLDEFDQIFIELFGKNWNIRAGDIDLQNINSYFGRFTKKIQGISLGGTLEHDSGARTSAFASGALVTGVFQRSQFIAEEGNQGPYKLVGPNGELFILIISGSERVYVNGLLLQRGENKDYVIDYNAGEIRFNPTYPITANMRITVEYQFTDQNYTRFIGYGGGNYQSDKLDLGVYIYGEGDAKNQPLQQSLTEEQVDVLKLAGDDMELMRAPSAVPDTFSENKILYRKDMFQGQEIFVFSANPQDELFNVRFSLVGDNMGDYVISSENTINRIFEFVPPVDGIPQGNYEPVVQLVAPVNLQVAGVNGQYRPTDKTLIDFEVAGSSNDLNLFSDLDDDDNDGYAFRFNGRQRVLKKDSLLLDALGSIDFINKDFRTVERLYNVEFNRDWNLVEPFGDQRFIIGGLELNRTDKLSAKYEFQNLDFSENFSGSRHILNSYLKAGRWNILLTGSLLNSEGSELDSEFSRVNLNMAYSLKKAWIGGKVWGEDNQVKAVENDSLTPISQRLSMYEVYTGIGDSTKVFAEAGYRYQKNDSVRNGGLVRVNSSNTVFLKSRILNSPNAQLSVFANYRVLKDEDGDDEDEQSLNSRLLYNQTILNGGIRWTTVLESNNGVIAQQEFTYIAVEPGQGIYTWNDYNNNGIQELEEFEIAEFQDQAEYVRILLPNQVFVKIRNNKFSQTLSLNPQSWTSSEGFKKFLSHFFNQTSYILDRKVRREPGEVVIDPFRSGGDNELGLALNFRNTLFYNRGKQKYSTSYTYLTSSTSNLISLGLQTSELKSHQLNFNHKIKESWLVNFRGNYGTNESISENFANRNFQLDSYELNPKLSYLLNLQTRFDIFYGFLNRENVLGEMETLDQQRLGFSFAYNNVEKIALNGEFNYIDNSFEGSAFSPVAYQMLEGLQPGTNFTWNLLLQKRLTKFLDANLSYFGRKSENSKTIHTGSFQLRAYF